MPALGVAVLNVVVNEREVVDKLDGDGGGQSLFHRSADRLRAKQAECGSHRLAAVGLDRTAELVGPAHVIAEHAEQRRVLVEGAAQPGIHRGTVTGEDVGYAHGGGHVGVRGLLPSRRRAVGRDRSLRPAAEEHGADLRGDPFGVEVQPAALGIGGAVLDE